MASCNHDCLNCIYDDCINDDITKQEIKDSQSFDIEVKRESHIYDGNNFSDWKYNTSKQGKERSRRYDTSEKGKARSKRYNDSEKGKARTEKYNHSENGKLARERYEKKRPPRKRNRVQIPYSERKEYFHELYLRKKQQAELNC